jgi:hypothetical protein
MRSFDLAGTEQGAERISGLAKPRSQTRGLESVKVFSILSILFAIAGAFAGLKGAYYWYLSSTVQIGRWGGNEPLPFPDGQQRQEMLNRTTAVNTLWLAGMFEAAQQTARLNKKAARWTAVAVVLGGASSLFSSLA